MTQSRKSTFFEIVSKINWASDNPISFGFYQEKKSLTENQSNPIGGQANELPPTQPNPQEEKKWKLR